MQLYSIVQQKTQLPSSAAPNEHLQKIQQYREHELECYFRMALMRIEPFVPKKNTERQLQS